MDGACSIKDGKSRMKAVLHQVWVDEEHKPIRRGSILIQHIIIWSNKHSGNIHVWDNVLVRIRQILCCS